MFLFSTVITADIQVPVGNFALPSSRQPSPLFSLGQNLVDKNEWLLVETFDYLKGPTQHSFILYNALLYGLSDRASLLFTVPSIPHQKQLQYTSRGIGDISAQVEYGLYINEKPTSIDAITILYNVQVPSGSVLKKPITGAGAPSFFLGTTASYTSIDWYLFTSYALNLPLSHNHKKVGNQFFYEFGIGLNFGNPGGGILLGLMEFNGIKTQKANDHIVPSFPQGNIIFLGPSVYLATKNLVLQAGIQFPIMQQLLSKNDKGTLRCSIQLTWHFGGNVEG